MTWSGLWMGWVRAGMDVDGGGRWVGGREEVVVSV